MAKRLSDAVGELATERIALLLADRVADRVVKALKEAGFDQQFANELLLTLNRQLERKEGEILGNAGARGFDRGRPTELQAEVPLTS